MRKKWIGGLFIFFMALTVALPVWAAEDTIKLGVTEPLFRQFFILTTGEVGKYDFLYQE